jgi:hypothetical protein
MTKRKVKARPWFTATALENDTANAVWRNQLTRWLRRA